MQIYRKMHLVPFGEYIPFRRRSRRLRDDWRFGAGGFTLGTEPKVLTLDNPRLLAGALICFEDTLGELTRRFVQNGAQVPECDQ